MNETLLETSRPPAFRATPASVDERALRILQAHGRVLERTLASYVRGEADRADLRQDVALALWSALGRFRGDCSERTFLLRIAHNRALTFLSKRGLAAEELDDRAEQVMATTGKNPAVTFERMERANRLLRAVRALPIAQRQVVTLLLEGLSHREIAEVLGTTENNIAVRSNRVRAALRVLLETEPGGADAGAGQPANRQGDVR